MIKKVLLGTAVTAILGTMVFGRMDVMSYFRTSFKSVQEAVKAEVPLEFEINRARDLVDHLVPDIKKCMHVIAEEEVNVEQLTAEVARQKGTLGKQKEQILALRGDLDGGSSEFKYAGRTYTPDEVKQDLARRFERFKIANETLENREKILEARKKSLTAARTKLNNMLSEKQDLEVQIEHLDARLKTLRAAETASEVVIDDSQLARAKKLIKDLDKQLDVRARVLAAEGELTGEIPVDADSDADVPADLSRQIDDYFDRDEAAPVVGKDL